MSVVYHDLAMLPVTHVDDCIVKLIGDLQDMLLSSNFQAIIIFVELKEIADDQELLCLLVFLWEADSYLHVDRLLE